MADERRDGLRLVTVDEESSARFGAFSRVEQLPTKAGGIASSGAGPMRMLAADGALRDHLKNSDVVFTADPMLRPFDEQSFIRRQGRREPPVPTSTAKRAERPPISGEIQS